MQITDLSKELSIPAFLRLGFRPFFSAASLFAIVSISLWLLVYTSNISVDLYGSGYFWHLHEMIYGFSCAVIIGFLLTAVQTWTGHRALNGWPLLALFFLWLAGRVLFIFPNLLGDIITAVIDVLFLPCAAYALAMPILKIKQYRNLFFIPLLLCFAALNCMMHLSLYFEFINTRQIFFSALMLISLLMSIMIGRVAPMFTANGTNTKKVEPIKLLEQSSALLLIMLTVSYLVSAFITISNTWFFLLFLFAGIAQLCRLIRLKPWITLSTPLLWSLHGAIAYIALGLLSLSISYLFQQSYLNHLWHILTIGGIGGLILAMISRVSLGHTGQPLTPHKLMSLGFLMLVIAPLLRALGPTLAPQLTLEFIWISGVFWILAFSCFSCVYTPMLIKTRADGRPG